MHDEKPPRSGSLAAVGAWLLFVSLAVGALLLARTGASEPQGPPPHDESARAFLQAWQRYRTSTFVAVGTFHRNATDGGLQTPYLLAQRPPQRTLLQFGAFEALTGEGSQHCSVNPEGDERCTSGPAEEPYDQRVQNEISALLGYFFATDPPLYDVVQVGPDCFELLLRRERLPAPYGLSTRFCFDPATGAVVEMVQHHERGIDLLEITEVRTRVSDADLAPVLPETPPDE